MAGTLHVSSDGDLRLTLIGSLGEGRQVATKAHKIILGSVDKSPRGNDVTLSGCILISASHGSYHMAREEYHASRCFFGAHIEKLEHFSFRLRSPEPQRTVGVGAAPFGVAPGADDSADVQG